MLSFTICLLLLIGGYFIYGRFVEKIIKPDDRKTPAVDHPDGVDYIPMPAWKIYMIQFLNIAGLGPIFGAIMGSQFGTASFIWIVVGTIFAGATHDYLAGMLSLRNNGESLPETVGRYLGLPAKQVMRIFTVVLLILVGAVFASGPAGLLAGMTPQALDATFWVIVIMMYYVLATLLPIDKVIGKIYPLFAASLIFMAVGILVMLYWYRPDIPEFTESFGINYTGLAIFPMMFVSIACGAISGFHATQSPLMARCMTHEKQGRRVFYGAMVTEGIVALIWAAAATYFFKENGISYLVGDKEVLYTGADVASKISKDWLGPVGGILAILGIIAAPISTGDTALRSARLMIADFLGIEQRTISKRLLICIPLFLVTIGILLFSISNKEGFNIIWRYFAWSNQTLSVFTLWALTAYLTQKHKPYLITMIPALFMTAVCVSYICMAPEGFQLSQTLSYTIGMVCVVISLIWYIIWRIKFNKKYE
ncbi:carbon starvation protein A [Bacteroides sp. 519]|uniref:carbon starvation CstA family protein n=1 Tax=Bacteroides sp. 519 TaxID=2302937 RepID=UPI0013CFE1E5|nr:carbon starvation protein A [Bacteroides sp. 519]NDV58117.1 carbon starvation protein A [Bacteroides sp. 519]